MKPIQPIQLWINGSTKTAEWLNAYVINDNLLDSATFYWQLMDVDKQSLSQGNLTMDGQSYIDWNNDDTDINNAAYQWIATQLGLTII